MYKKTNSVIKAIEDAGMDIKECPQLMLLIKSGVDFSKFNSYDIENIVKDLGVDRFNDSFKFLKAAGVNFSILEIQGFQSLKRAGVDFSKLDADCIKEILKDLCENGFKNGINFLKRAGVDLSILGIDGFKFLKDAGVDFPSNLFITGSSRDLIYFETITLAKFFPLGDISKVKYVGTGSAIVKSLEDPLCVTHYCFQGENVTFHKEKESSYTPYLPKGYQHSRSDNPCISNEFTCLDHKNTITYASYNCIGWAFGVSEWIEPFKLYGTPEEIVTKGVEDAKKDFPANHPSNVLNIIEKLDLDKISTIPILKNNTVAFYFCINDIMCHAARYLTTLSDGEVLNNWVSKLGPHPELFAHDYEYMLNADDGCYERSLFPKECYDGIYFVPVKDEEIMGKSLDFREF